MYERDKDSVAQNSKQVYGDIDKTPEIPGAGHSLLSTCIFPLLLHLISIFIFIITKV